MKLFLLITFAPIMLFFNVIGVLCALVAVGVTNGYVKAIEFMDKLPK